MSRLIDADKLIEDVLNSMPTGSARGVFRAFIEEQPTFDYEKMIGQYIWERDVAIKQLEQLGIGFGQKLEDEVIEKVKEVIRCD